MTPQESEDETRQNSVVETVGRRRRVCYDKSVSSPPIYKGETMRQFHSLLGSGLLSLASLLAVLTVPSYPAAAQDDPSAAAETPKDTPPPTAAHAHLRGDAGLQPRLPVLLQRLARPAGDALSPWTARHGADAGAARQGARRDPLLSRDANGRRTAAARRLAANPGISPTPPRADDADQQRTAARCGDGRGPHRAGCGVV